MEKESKLSSEVTTLENIAYLWIYNLNLNTIIILWVGIATLDLSFGKTHSDSYLSESRPRRDSLFLGLQRNFPISSGQRVFKPGYIHGEVIYRHLMDANWQLGIGGGFRVFALKDRDEETALLTIYQEILWRERLYYPVYLVTGPRLLYIYPAKRAVFPTEREESLEIEIGWEWAVELNFESFPFIYGASWSRWRGTKTSKIQGQKITFKTGYVL